MPSTRPSIVRERLDAAAVATHLRSLAATAEHVELRIKGGAGAHSEPASSLDDAGRRLLAGQVVAVQIRFFEHDDWWCDTLLRARSDYRLVRIREGT